jgi:hypothetical protein
MLEAIASVPIVRPFRRRLLVATVLLGLAGCSGQSPPIELQRLQAVTDPLLVANRIQSTPIHFTLQLGDSAAFWAQTSGLCKPSNPGDEDACSNWSHHTPGPSTSATEAQVQRLAYLIGSANAITFPHGLIAFDRSFFLEHQDDDAALRCVVAHELTHFLHRHAYLSARAEADRLRHLPNAEKKRALAALSQEQELAADRNAMLMVAVAGHDPAACVQELQLTAELDAMVHPDDPLGTHPGHGRRLKAARDYLSQRLPADLRRRRQQLARTSRIEARPVWTWNPSDQLYTVRTRPGRPGG